MTVTLKEARDALWALQQFLNQLSEAQEQGQGQKQEQSQGKGEPNSITEKQKKFIKDLCKRKGRPEPQNLDQMTREEASKLIDELRG